VNRLTGEKLGAVDLAGSPLGVVVIAPEGGRLVQLTELIDAERARTTLVATVDSTTGALIGEQVAIDGRRRIASFSADGSHILIVTQPTRNLPPGVPGGGGSDPGGPPLTGPTTFTVINAVTGRVVGDPLTLEGSLSNYQLHVGDEGDRAYVTLLVTDEATNSSTTTAYLLDLWSGATTTV